MSKGVAVVAGAGQGLGASIARRFAKEGYAIAVMARNKVRLEELCQEIVEGGGQAVAINVDVSQPESVAEAFASVRDQLGEVAVLVYNVGAFRIESLLETSPEDFEKSWKLNCFGAFLCTREVIPAMLEHGQGSILLTSATGAVRGGARFACLAVGKFGLRALAQSTAREFGPQGIHVAHLIIDGLIDTERIREIFPDAQVKLDPDDIAETYWQVHQQPRSAWTLELDLRPAEEKF